jgi:hypothetical protein
MKQQYLATPLCRAAGMKQQYLATPLCRAAGMKQQYLAKPLCRTNRTNRNNVTTDQV